MASFIVSTIVWTASGRLCPIAFRSMSSRICSASSRVGALRPGPALVDGQAAIADRDRLFDPRRVGGQVDVADQALRWLGTRRRCGGRSGRGKTRRRPVGARARGRRPARPSRRDGPSDSAATSVSSVRAKSACQASRSRRAAQQCRVGAIDLGEGHRAEPVEQSQAGVERGRDRRRLDPPGGNAAAALEMLEGRQPGRGPLAGDHRDRPGPGVVDQDRHLAAETERPRIRHAQGQDRGGAPRPPRCRRSSGSPSPAATASRPPADTAPCVPAACQSVTWRGDRRPARRPTASWACAVDPRPESTRAQDQNHHAADHRPHPLLEQ